MCVGSCLRVQVGMEGASGDVCHVREFTAGAAVRPRSARCLVCIAQGCVTSDAPPDLLTRQSGMLGLPSLPAAGETFPHPNGMRRAVLRSRVPFLPTPGVSLNDRPVMADRGTGCGGNAVGSQKNRNHLLRSYRFVPLKPGVCSGSDKEEAWFYPPWDPRRSSACCLVSLCARDCETLAETQQLISYSAGQWGGEVRLAGFFMSGAQNPLEVSKGDGAALLLWEAEKGICLTFLSLFHSVAMPVLPFPCQYSCFYVGTAVARLR